MTRGRGGSGAEVSEFLSTNPTDSVFCANPAVFIAFQKNKKFFIPTDPTMF